MRPLSVRITYPEFRISATSHVNKGDANNRNFRMPADDSFIKALPFRLVSIR